MKPLQVIKMRLPEQTHSNPNT